MRKIVLAVSSAAVLAAVFVGCGGSGPSPAACKAAMKAELANSLATGAHGTEPAACHGLSPVEVEKLANEVLAGTP